jgi:hypothetical protein
MQFGPDPRTGTEHQKANGLPAVTQRQDEQPSAPILACFRITHQRSGAVIDLRFFADGCFNDHPCLGCRRSAQLSHEAFHAGVFVAEAVAVHQVLPDGHGVSPFGQFGFDELAVRFADACR